MAEAGARTPFHLDFRSSVNNADEQSVSCFSDIDQVATQIFAKFNASTVVFPHIFVSLEGALWLA